MTAVGAAPTFESVLMRLSMPLRADLTVPAGARSVIVFAQGSGSSRRSPRNGWVAGQLRAAGFATLLFDPLTEAEDVLPHLRFDIPIQAQRLVEATEWAGMHRSTRNLRVGYFGASTGAAAVLMAAAQRPEIVRAVVCRGGRPDLAGESLHRVTAPTRLVVGQRDQECISLNRTALAAIGASCKDLVVVPGASHLFEEPGALARAAELATDWFRRHVDPEVEV